MTFGDAIRGQIACHLGNRSAAGPYQDPDRRTAVSQLVGATDRAAAST